MLEKMENMTKELRKRNTLLEKAEVRAKEVEKLAEQLSQVDVQTARPHSSKLAPAVSQVHSNNNLDIASIAPITPLPLCNSPLLPYNNLGHDDMYMGDSESDGQKERRDRKAAKKREKKRWQREKNSDDSDVTIKSVEDRMVKQGIDCDDNNSDNKSYKWKRKAVKKGKAPQREENSDGNVMIGLDEDKMVEEGLDFNEDDEDYEVVDADMASPLNWTRSELLSSFSKNPRFASSFVHPPYKFSKPRGGAGPRLWGKPSQIHQDTSNMISNPLNLPLDELTTMTCTILSMMQKEGNILTHTPRRKIISQKIKMLTVWASGTRHKKLAVGKLIDFKVLMD
jgi:hypothetical protein